jgi:hypothetical protein
VTVEVELTCLEIGLSVASCCEHVDKPACSITDAKFLGQLSEYLHTNKDIVLRSYLVDLYFASCHLHVRCCSLGYEYNSQVFPFLTRMYLCAWLSGRTKD